MTVAYGLRTFKLAGITIDSEIHNNMFQTMMKTSRWSNEHVNRHQDGNE